VKFLYNHPISCFGAQNRPLLTTPTRAAQPLPDWSPRHQPSSSRVPPSGVTPLRITSIVGALLGMLALCGAASAQTITGTVTNGTTGKPAAGDEVTLLSLSQGMEEVGSARTDAQGRFSLALADKNAPHMVRVTHGGVNYFPKGGPVMPGATSAQITVYDTAKKIDGLTQTVEVDRYEAQGDTLQGIALFAVSNESNPPRTLDSEQTFEFVLPTGATLDTGMVKGPGGQPLNMPPTETAQKGHYAFSFPLKPGETQFQGSYHMPYKGKASFSPKPLANVQHLVVMTPPGMTFTPRNPQRFQSMPDQPGVMVATNVTPDEELSFLISGTGQFPTEGQQAARGDEAGAQPAGRDNRPGGGLGAPIDSNDPLHDYRAVILGALAVVLVMGGAYVIAKSNNQSATSLSHASGKRKGLGPRHPARASSASSEQTLSSAVDDEGGASQDQLEVSAFQSQNADPSKSHLFETPRDRRTKLLEVMKEELFQLELDRQQGRIASDEYERAKAALDETIRRAVAMSSSQ